MSDRMEIDEELSDMRIESRPVNSEVVTTSSDAEQLSGTEASRSLKSEAGEPIPENDRYYANETYFMPCDELEQTRLNIMHQAYLSLLDRQLTFGPFPRTAKRVLDLGAGTGEWAMAVAERLTKAEIIATDISSRLQPGVAPVNVTFEIDDAEAEWTYNEPFDFIHLSGLNGAFSNWDSIYREAAKHLKLSCYIEVVDHGLIQLKNEPEDSALTQFNAALLSAAEKAGRSVNAEHMDRQRLENAGLNVAKSRVVELPLGNWSDNPKLKTAGKMATIGALEGLEAMGLRLLTRYGSRTAAETRVWIEKAQEEVINQSFKAFIQVHFLVARNLGL